MDRIIKILIFLPLGFLHADSPENYHVHETNAGLELITPYGKKVILGDYAPDGGFNYRIEIPLSEIKPPASLSPSPTPAPQAMPPMVIQNMLQPPPPQNADEAAKKEAKATEPRDLAAIPPTQKIIVEYDETDRLVLEANRLYNRKKYYESTQVVEEILRRKPDYVRAWVMKGSLMYAQKQPDLAKKAWTQALALEPGNTQVKSLIDKLK